MHCYQEQINENMHLGETNLYSIKQLKSNSEILFLTTAYTQCWGSIRNSKLVIYFTQYILGYQNYSTYICNCMLSDITVQNISVQRKESIRYKNRNEPKTLLYTITVSVLCNKNIELSHNSVVRTTNHFFHSHSCSCRLYC